MIMSHPHEDIFQNPGSDTSVHLRNGWKILKKRRLFIFLFFLCTIFLVSVYTFTVTPHYKATSKVMIEKETGNNLTATYSPPSAILGFYETQLQVIKSRAVARRVVDLLSLGEESAHLFEIKEKGGGRFSLKTWMAGITSGEDQEEKLTLSLKDRMANSLIENLSVELVKNSRIVVVSYRSFNPEFAALVANTTAKAYVEETLDMNMVTTRRSLEWMTKKAESERKNLENAENSLQAYMKANDIVTLENRIAITPDELKELSTQLVRAETERKRIEALYREVRNIASAENFSAITVDPSLRVLRSQIVEVEKNIMELSGRYGSKHPAMEKAMGDLKVLKEKKNQEVQRLVASIKNDYELALANERNLRDQLQRSKEETLRVNEKSVQYRVLKREVETNQQLYDSLMMKIKEQNITEETNPLNVWIVEEAQVPPSPAKPIKALNLSVGLLFGLLGGVAMALFLEYFDNSVKTLEEAESVLGVPVLGMVDRCTGKNKIEQIVTKDPLSGTAEGYKALRSTLLLSSADGPPRKILITSSVPGEGKTSTAANLALVMAQAENRVLLIDGDLRKPRLHHIFNLKNQVGLSNYLAGTYAGANLLQKTQLPNLAVLTSGPTPPNPAELLLSQRMKQLIESLEHEFDIIICDSPPVLAVSDPGILNRLFDGVILVIQAHKTNFDMAAKSIRSLRDVQARLLGVMLNGVNVKKGDYYYYTDNYVNRPGKKAARTASTFRASP
jgi:polysaccharide biosynthesis transport protein